MLDDLRVVGQPKGLPGDGLLELVGVGVPLQLRDEQHQLVNVLSLDCLAVEVSMVEVRHP